MGVLAVKGLEPEAGGFIDVAAIKTHNDLEHVITLSICQGDGQPYPSLDLTKAEVGKLISTLANVVAQAYAADAVNILQGVHPQMSPTP